VVGRGHPRRRARDRGLRVPRAATRVPRRAGERTVPPGAAHARADRVRAGTGGAGARVQRQRPAGAARDRRAVPRGTAAVTPSAWMPVLVILSSLVTGLVMFLLPEERQRTRTALNLTGAVVKILLVAAMLWGVWYGESYLLR